MKIRLRTKSGSLEFNGQISKRYRVIAKEGTTDLDRTQFWTYIKYEFSIDHNPLKSVIGCKDYTLRKIKSRWGTKFSFET